MRKTRAIFLFLQMAATLLFISSSCNRTEVGKPSGNLLNKQQVEELLLEVYFIESKARVLIYNESAEKVKMQLNYEMKTLFERYNTSYQQFVNSYSYYMGDASVSKKMIADITNKLIVLETEQTKNNKSADSLFNNKLKMKDYEYFKSFFSHQTVDTLIVE
jgi:hypothetical protein